MYLKKSKIGTCSACQFMNNQAKGHGGALALTGGSQMDTCLSCQFERNTANSVRNQSRPCDTTLSIHEPSWTCNRFDSA